MYSSGFGGNVAKTKLSFSVALLDSYHLLFPTPLCKISVRQIIPWRPGYLSHAPTPASSNSLSWEPWPVLRGLCTKHPSLRHHMGDIMRNGLKCFTINHELGKIRLKHIWHMRASGMSVEGEFQKLFFFWEDGCGKTWGCKSGRAKDFPGY